MSASSFFVTLAKARPSGTNLHRRNRARARLRNAAESARTDRDVYTTNVSNAYASGQMPVAN